MATVRGTVVARDLIESPLTGDRCVYYSYTVETWRHSQVVGISGDGFWEVSQHDEAIVEFYLQDGAERAIVAPLRAHIERGKAVAANALDTEPNVRAQQLMICPGDFIEVTGRVHTVHDLFDGDRAYRTSPARVMLRAPVKTTIIIRLIERADLPLSA